MPTKTDTIIERYCDIRQQSFQICSPLEIEDYVVQPNSDLSPPKWHLAHTTWFFEEMLLVPHLKGYKRYSEQFSHLFNSYYKGAGKHWIQSERGQLSRPTVSEVHRYREHVDGHMTDLISSNNLNKDALLTLEIGLQHEQQHQELLLMDIKQIFAVNPCLPTYSSLSLAKAEKHQPSWQGFEAGLVDIGHSGDDYAYDNESPKHRHYLDAFEMSSNTVTNAEFLEFINDGAYQHPRFWLSLGWNWVQTQQINAPLYWKKQHDGFYEFTLHGLQQLDPNAPVTHVSYFEANAYANWAGARLATEQESEIFLKAQTEVSRETSLLHPTNSSDAYNQVWCWTQSQYCPYPGFKAFAGVLGEYNGKFMCNQHVLRGGCVVTPDNHIRATYRNFYLAHQRWMFSGIRLARSLS